MLEGRHIRAESGRAASKEACRRFESFPTHGLISHSVKTVERPRRTRAPGGSPRRHGLPCPRGAMPIARLQAVEVTGQDILTRDKVGPRLNLSATWRYV